MRLPLDRRQQAFFCDDYLAYLDLMAPWSAAHRVEVWCYCRMPNHVHLIAVPATEDGAPSERRTVVLRGGSTFAARSRGFRR